MMEMMEIKLENVVFQANHGVFEFEKENGNVFELNLTVRFPAPPKTSLLEDSLDNTVSYADLFEIAREKMLRTSNLLETVVSGIAIGIKARFPYLVYIDCSLTKLHPPIKGFNGKATARYILSD